MPVSYQFVLIDGDPAGTASREAIASLISKLTTHLKSMGIDPAHEVRFFQRTDLEELNFRVPTAAVYFGAESHTNPDPVVGKFLENGIFVLPVVTDLTKVHLLLPEPLREINVMLLEPTDKNLDAVAPRLLEELRLLRAKRQAFISYKRGDSRGVAEQLYHALDERSFDVFLDTHSVERGVKFQPMLWDRMGDADLVILLDTPNAFSSVWVDLEVTRANALGLGILQLVWPNHTRTVGTNFCEPEYLSEDDFVDGVATSVGRLKPERVAEISAKAESLRARTMAARRTRVIGEICRSASNLGIGTSVHVMGPIVIKHPKQGAVVVLPVVGHPDSHLIHESYNSFKKLEKQSGSGGWVIYDPLGMWDAKFGHLSWLNEYLPVRTLAVTEVEAWLEKAH